MTMRNGVLTDQKKLHLGSMEYFLALAHQIQTKDDAKGIELAAQLAALLEQQVYEYTLGDSSSVPIELAEALLQSVYYRIGLALKQRGGGALTLFPLRQLFDEGRQIAEKRVKKARQALFVLQRTSVDGGSIAYHDTVFKALPAFFRNYDPRFLAHETPCDIDYQLCLPVEELCGIEYVEAYIVRLSVENNFCADFDAERFKKLLSGFCPGYREQLINLFGPVFQNAVGRALLGGEIETLDITEEERRLLLLRLEPLSDDRLAELTHEALDAVCSNFCLPKAEAGYLKAAWAQVLPRLHEQLSQGNIDALFVSFAKKRPKPLRFTDGAAMPDEKLRVLIEEMKGCRHLSDKLTMVKSHVYSLSDFTEVADACFEDGEYDALFSLLRGIEAAVLLRRMWQIYGGQTQDVRDWERGFLRYIDSMDQGEASRIKKAAKRLREK